MRPGQKAAGQMGTSICTWQPGPEEDIHHQALDLTDQPHALQGVLPVNTPHMYNDMKAHLLEKLNISTIQKSHSTWASTVVLL